MEHNHVLKKVFLPFDPTPRVGGGKVLWAKYLLPCYYIHNSLLFDMQQDQVLKMLNFGLLTLL